MEHDNTLWLAKVAAWTHDPAEKALVLMRDPDGHEGGTVRELRAIAFPEGMPEAIRKAVKQADHWAAAADRPQFGGGGREHWAQVNFDAHPVLTHPLSGEEFKLKPLNINAQQIRAVSTDHFKKLLEPVANDPRKAALQLWRFGPEMESTGSAKELGALWRMLPADTRIPDHTIWSHLDLAGAFASGFIGDESGDIALLAMSFGPVQDFIAQARTTSDLWAGSHLLSRITWEGMQVLCEEIGPDAVVLPQLRGVPQVDLWLQDRMGLDPALFKNMDWVQRKTDANPLFVAALPNRFVAIVPAGRAAELAGRITEKVREWVRTTGATMLADLLRLTGTTNDSSLPCHAQLNEQLQNFPEVHWAAVPFSLIARNDKGLAAASQPELAEASRPYLGNVDMPGFLGSHTWKQVLCKSIAVDGATIYTPNPGVLYPAIYDLLDRIAAATKTVRPFSQARAEGYRCDLTGETEWLTTDRNQLRRGRSSREETLWTKARKQLPGLLRKGEHLGALGMLKRMWPRHFVQEMRDVIGGDLQRYVVSTHAMSMSTSLERWLQSGGLQAQSADEHQALIDKVKQVADSGRRAILPARLIKQLHKHDDLNWKIATTLPLMLDDDLEESTHGETASQISARNSLRGQVNKLLGKGATSTETYYGLILLDGDRMGAWLSGTDDDYRLPYKATWHPRIRASAESKFPALRDYMNEARAVSPARHMAISSALNDFAMQLARHVVEDLCKGKLIYAGGDDVMAMVAVDDLLRCLLLLRLAYSGLAPTGDGDVEKRTALFDMLGLQDDEQRKFQLGAGHALLQGQLLRLMGNRATASAGAVIAHHMAPMSAVLRKLRSTEKRAKRIGRDAMALSLLKRSGGAIEIALPWVNPMTDQTAKPWQRWHEALAKGLQQTSPVTLLMALTECFAGDTSRRAAYITEGWLRELPSRDAVPLDTLRQMIEANLHFQLRRQTKQASADTLAQSLAKLVCEPTLIKGQEPAELLASLLGVAEFLARDTRSLN